MQPILRRWTEIFARWRRECGTRAALERLDPHLLEDIGVSWSMINDEARSAAGKSAVRIDGAAPALR